MQRMILSLMAMFFVLSISAQSENEAIKNIMTRTSIRKYTDQPVSKADIETLLRAGMAAPTAVNKQPWHFVAVTDKAKLKELSGGRGGMLEQCALATLLRGLHQRTSGSLRTYRITSLAESNYVTSKCLLAGLGKKL